MSSEVVGVSLTVAATVISVYNTVLFYRQSRLVEKQTLLQRSQVYPYLRIRDTNVKQNVFTLTLENKGESPAFDLGLLVSFVPCSGFEKHWQFVDSVAWSGDPDMKRGYPTRTVIPLKNKKGISRLYEKETDEYEAEPLFEFRSTDKEGSWGGKGKADNFGELKKRLTGQGMRFVAVMPALVYKDVAETVNEFEPIKAFVVDFQKHNSLQEAYKEGIPFYDKTIGYEEMPFYDYYSYQHFKSYRGRLDE